MSNESNVNKLLNQIFCFPTVGVLECSLCNFGGPSLKSLETLALAN